MNTENVSGMDMPQQNASNFQESIASTKDEVHYLFSCIQVAKTTSETAIKYLTGILEEHLQLCRELSQNLDRVANMYKALLLIDLKFAFKVGEFYTLETVEAKLSKIYEEYDYKISHNDGDLIFEASSPSIKDFITNSWFKYQNEKRKVKGKFLDGIIITECLFEKIKCKKLYE